MSNVLIDLGEVPQPQSRTSAEPRVAGPPFPFRIALGALSILLLALLAGAVAHVPPAPPTIIPASLGDVTFVDGHQLYVVSTGRPVLGTEVQNRVVGIYSLPGAELQSLTTVAVSGGINWVWSGAGTVLVSYQVDTSGIWAVAGLAEGTDQAVWRRSARLVGASAADGLVVLTNDDAEMGVDLATGNIRWSVPHPPDGYTAEAGGTDGFPQWLVTVTDSGRLETRDARTSDLIAEVTVPRLAGRANGLIWPVGDRMLVDRGGSGFDAYQLPGLQHLWRTPTDLSQSWMQADCGSLICTFRQQRGMTALDPATGRELWTSDQWAYAEGAGPYLLASSQEHLDGAPWLTVLDPASGRPVGDFGDWQGLGPAGGGLLYGKRDAAGHVVYYGLLDPATRDVRILGSADRVSGDCQTTADVLTCRLIDASIAIWRLR